MAQNIQFSFTPQLSRNVHPYSILPIGQPRLGPFKVPTKTPFLATTANEMELSGTSLPPYIVFFVFVFFGGGERC